MPKLPEPPEFDFNNLNDDSSPISVGDLDLPLPERKSLPSLEEKEEDILDLPMPSHNSNWGDLSNLPEPIGLEEIAPAQFGELEPVQFLPIPAQQELQPTFGDIEPVKGDLKPIVLDALVPKSEKPTVKEISAISEEVAAAPVIPKYNASRSPSPKELPKESNRVLKILISVGGLVAMIGSVSYGLYIFDEEKSQETIQEPQIVVPLKEEKQEKIVVEKVKQKPKNLTSSDIRTIEQAYSLFAKNLDELNVIQARKYFQNNDFINSVELLEKVLSAQPDHLEANVLLAEILLKSGDFAKALNQIDIAMSIHKTGEMHLIRGKILEFMNKHKEAIPEYTRALQLDPNIHEAKFLHGRMMYYTNNLGLAEQELTEASKDLSQNAQVWLSLGKVQRSLGKHKKASVSFKQAFTLDQKLTEARDLFIESKVNSGK